MSSTSCPVFRPTPSEFSDFRAYIAQIEKSIDLENTGICKIIPPEGYSGLVDFFCMKQQ